MLQAQMFSVFFQSSKRIMRIFLASIRSVNGLWVNLPHTFHSPRKIIKLPDHNNVQLFLTFFDRISAIIAMISGVEDVGEGDVSFPSDVHSVEPHSSPSSFEYH